MAKSKEPIVVKKYSNRRLYHGGTYLTLKDFAGMVKSDKDFKVSIEAPTRERKKLRRQLRADRIKRPRKSSKSGDLSLVALARRPTG
jgi:polyhydroxyalkanoate synthesis regulator protein